MRVTRRRGNVVFVETERSRQEDEEESLHRRIIADMEAAAAETARQNRITLGALLLLVVAIAGLATALR